MKKLIMAFTVAATLLIGMAFAPGVVGGVSAANAPEGCEKIRGTIVCGPIVENVGNAPEHSNAQETETTTTKKGSINSSHEEEETCDGPPGQCK